MPLPDAGRSGGERLGDYFVFPLAAGAAGAQALGKNVCEATLLTCPRVMLALGGSRRRGTARPGHRRCSR